MRYRKWVGIGSGIVLGIIFVTSGTGKIAEPTEFITLLNYSSFLPYELTTIVAQWLPWVELVLGLYLITGIATKIFSSVSCLTVISFIFQNTWLITHGLAEEDCGCFGKIENIVEIERQITLSSQNALYMDIGMLALIAAVLLCYPGKLFTLHPWWWFLVERKHKDSPGNSDGI